MIEAAASMIEAAHEAVEPIRGPASGPGPETRCWFCGGSDFVFESDDDDGGSWWSCTESGCGKRYWFNPNYAPCPCDRCAVEGA